MSPIGCTVIVLIVVAPPAWASNGLNLIGFGAESVAMGGADIAVARDTSALNTNPAGLTQIEHQRLDNLAGAAFALNVRHRDQFGNDAGVENSPILFAEGGYARRLGEGPVVLGGGLFAQGGAGYEYHNLKTAFGTEDELSSLFRILKLSIGGAVEVDERLSVGASVAVVYSDLEQRIFPQTSFQDPTDPGKSFFGFKVKNAIAIGVGGKLGVQYRVSERVTLGATYTSKTNLDLEGGQFVSNRSAEGLGSVEYGDVAIGGVNLPQEVGLGIALRPTEKLLLAFEVNWIDWSSAVDQAKLVAQEPNNPAAPPTVVLTAEHDWRDQYVIALGIAYDVGKQAVLRAGYNYGRNPIPRKNLTPMLAAITEHHLTFGIGSRLGKKWRMDLALEYQVNKEVTYSNPSLPFGPGAEEANEALIFHLMFSRVW